MGYKNIDTFIIEFSKQIVELNNLKNKDIKKFEKNISKMYDKLRKRDKIGTDQNLWIELYFQSTYLYLHLKKIGDIPITIVTKHNHILPFYMRKKISKLNTTILHFDTHPDMNMVKQSGILPTLYEKFLKTKNDKYITKAQDIVWDIGSAISGVLMTTGPQNYIWCMPEWVPDSYMNIPYSIKYNKEEVLLITNDEKYKDEPLCDLVYSSKKFEDNKNIYAKVQTGKEFKSKGYKNTLNKLIDILGKNEEYILDIDLDYFVCNGQKFEKEEYFKEPYDLVSKNRTKTIIVNEDNPRDTTENTQELKKYNDMLKKELYEIKKRVSKFFRLIAGLKKRGYIPSHISISDSTNLEFSELCHCNSVSNGYVPKYFALFLNRKIQKGLRKLFEK